MNPEIVLERESVKSALNALQQRLMPNERLPYVSSVIRSVEDVDFTLASPKQRKQLEDTCALGIVNGAFHAIVESRRVHV